MFKGRFFGNTWIPRVVFLDPVRQEALRGPSVGIAPSILRNRVSFSTTLVPQLQLWYLYSLVSIQFVNLLFLRVPWLLHFISYGDAALVERHQRLRDVVQVNVVPPWTVRACYKSRNEVISSHTSVADNSYNLNTIKIGHGMNHNLLTEQEIEWESWYQCNTTRVLQEHREQNKGLASFFHLSSGTQHNPTQLLFYWKASKNRHCITNHAVSIKRSIHQMDVNTELIALLLSFPPLGT